MNALFNLSAPRLCSAHSQAIFFVFAPLINCSRYVMSDRVHSGKLAYQRFPKTANVCFFRVIA